MSNMSVPEQFTPLEHAYQQRAQELLWEVDGWLESALDQSMAGDKSMLRGMHLRSARRAAEEFGISLEEGINILRRMGATLL